jgi:diguanylate cyclase (GGDEF)-like protein
MHLDMKRYRLINGSAYKILSRVTVGVVALAWILVALYVFSISSRNGYNLDFFNYFLSAEQSAVKFRALMLFGPLMLLLIAYLIHEKADLLEELFLAKETLKLRNIDLQNLTELLNRENTARRKTEERLIHRAFYDSLTNLPNRSFFIDHLQNALERKKRYPDHVFAVFFLDIDRFKVINDGLGHFVGDQLLVLFSQRLKKSVRTIDTVARFGGDEFAVLVDDAGKVSDVNELAERIKDEMRPHFSVFGHDIFASVSIGIVLSSQRDYIHPHELMRDADIAMYNAKSRGKSCHAIFDSAMHAEATTLHQLETELRKAVENNEFTLHYQPIISMENDRIIGFEALVRWQHPQRGIIPPLDFMTAAEETGLILPIGQWVIREACRQMRQWQEQFPEYKTLTVSANVSSKVFSQPDFYEVIEKILLDTGLEASRLRLEIVERMLIENPEPAAVLLKRLKDLKVQFDIDDFGTGYSALNYLRQFPINGLKIDRSFIEALASDKNNAEIVKTIIALAHALNLDVIAEGIETTEQLEIFRTMKGEYAQGFFIFRPMDGKAVEALLTMN